MTIDERAASPSSGDVPITDPERYEEIERKHAQISEFLEERDLDALLLQRPANLAWFTAGGDFTRGTEVDTTAHLFITQDARVVVTNNVESRQLFDLELAGLGFQLKERPWTESRQVLAADLCRGRRVASDAVFPETTHLGAALTPLRTVLTPTECERMRQIGSRVVHALEAAARSVEAGREESDIAGEIAHRLIRHQVTPLRIQVIGDGRGRDYRHWTYTNRPIRNWCTVTAVGTRWGLRVAAARTVALDLLDPSIVTAFQQATMIKATALFFSHADWELQETVSRVLRIYEKFEQPDEWRLADFGGIIGYDTFDPPAMPGSLHKLTPGTALSWHPSIGPALVGDSILVKSDGLEILTPPDLWPTVDVAVKGSPITCPAIYYKNLAPLPSSTPAP